MLDSKTTGREARVARTGKGRKTKNALALPEGSIIIIDELGRPLKQLPARITVNDKPPTDVTTDAFGRVYPLVADIDGVTLEFDETHEAGANDSIVTNSGQHFERGGAGPRTT